MYFGLEVNLTFRMTFFVILSIPLTFYRGCRF